MYSKKQLIVRKLASVCCVQRVACLHRVIPIRMPSYAGAKMSQTGCHMTEIQCGCMHMAPRLYAGPAHSVLSKSDRGC